MYKLHFPVLNKEVYDLVSNIKEKLLIIDCTYGAGGHSDIFLKCAHKVIAFDRDVNTISHNDIPLIHDKFSNLNKYIKYEKNNDSYNIYLNNNFVYTVNKIMIFADLGMSTMQLKNDRGFSFMTNSLLDMRMGNDGNTLSEKLAYMQEEEIERIIREYGEEKRSRVIASNIHKYRAKKKIETTFDLREAVGCDKFDVLARVFQAFRIYLNDELSEIYKLLQCYADYYMIISFHSLEDKIVKKFGKKQEIYIPTNEEINVNPPSRSAKMRFWKN
jgi:16S rRNA (cytosine1402-N4)-methyltransferase